LPVIGAVAMARFIWDMPLIKVSSAELFMVLGFPLIPAIEELPD
jgi:hypothetical protein